MMPPHLKESCIFPHSESAAGSPGTSSATWVLRFASPSWTLFCNSRLSLAFNTYFSVTSSLVACHLLHEPCPGRAFGQRGQPSTVSSEHGRSVLCILLFLFLGSTAAPEPPWAWPPGPPLPSGVGCFSSRSPYTFSDSSSGVQRLLYWGLLI